MFNVNQRYNQPTVALIVDQTCTFQRLIPMGDPSKYDRRGYASPSEYGALVCKESNRQKLEKTVFLLHCWRFF